MSMAVYASLLSTVMMLAGVLVYYQRNWAVRWVNFVCSSPKEDDDRVPGPGYRVGLGICGGLAVWGLITLIGSGLWTRIPDQTLVISGGQTQIFPRSVILLKGDRRLQNAKLVPYQMQSVTHQDMAQISMEAGSLKISYFTIGLWWGGKPEWTLPVWQEATKNNVTVEDWLGGVLATRVADLVPPVKVAYDKTAREGYREKVRATFADLPYGVRATVALPTKTLQPEDGPAEAPH
jgi:hypothetical protein